MILTLTTKAKKS